MNLDINMNDSNMKKYTKDYDFLVSIFNFDLPFMLMKYDMEEVKKFFIYRYGF